MSDRQESNAKRDLEEALMRHDRRSDSVATYWKRRVPRPRQDDDHDPYGDDQ